MAERTTCNDCTHPRTSHSTQGCLHDGACVYGCKVKYMQKDKFS